MTQPALDAVIDQLERMGRAFHGRLVALEAERDHLQARVAELEQRQLQYRGVWTEGEAYDGGDLVTDRGTIWFCHSPTMARPGTEAGAQGWQMMVKGNR